MLVVNKSENQLMIGDKNNQVFVILNEKIFSNEALVKIKGELRNESSIYVEDELMAFISIGKNLKLDLSEVTYLGSSSLSMFLTLQRLCESEDSLPSIVLCNLSSYVSKTLEDVGFDEILKIEQKRK